MRGVLLVLISLFSVPSFAQSKTVRPSCEELLTEWKLIRDLLPAIFKSEKDLTAVLQLDPVQDRELLIQILYKKLDEEILEFKTTPIAEEMADIQQVLIAIQKIHDLDPELVEKVRQQKLTKKGGFDQGFLMRLPRSTN